MKETSGTVTPLLQRFEFQCAALVLIAWANSLGSSFHFDDGAMFQNPWIVGSGFGSRRANLSAVPVPADFACILI